MYPIYSQMEPYHPRGRYMPPAYWYSPSPQAFPADNSSKPSAAYETWPPSPNNHGFLVPGYGCCAHASSPHWPYSGPSHQFHCCGHHHPPQPGPFWTPYPPPPFYYQMEQNPNGYSRGDGLSSEPSHCCLCPKHIHSQGNAKMVKAEEQEPDPEQSHGDSLLPLQMKDKPFPIVWIPNEHRKTVNDAEAPESRISRRGQVDALNNEAPGEKSPSKQHTTTSDGWFPLDIKDLASLLGDADKKRSWSHQNGDQKEQLQFPLVWLPSRQKPDKGVHEFESNSVNNVPNVSKSPMVKESSKNSEAGSEEKTKHQKTIPVVEVKPCKEVEKSKSEKGSESVSSSEGAKDDALMKTKRSNSKGQSPSQSKSARLSPVCLRVDPLPKKRSGSSRSPSPPGSKGKLQDRSLDSVRKTAPVEEKDTQGSLSLDCATTKEEQGERSADNGICKEVPENKNSGGGCAGDGNCAIREKTQGSRNEGDLRNESAGEKKGSSVTLGSGGPKVEHKKLSDEEAARLIQSVYRGYEVRKWEPLKKLRQIAGVREQVTEVKNQMHSLETSCDHPKNDKARAVIGEMIMGLLLKLDGIQGLHSSLRDIRKSLAKELVSLQEKLDSLVMNKSEETQEGKCISSNDTNLQQERTAVPGGQLVHNPSQPDDDMGSKFSNGCDTMQPSLPVTGVVKASQEVESPARHDPEFEVSDGGSDGGSPPGRDETTGMDVMAVVTNGRSESFDAIAAGATSLKGAGSDLKEKGPFMAEVDVNGVMQIDDGPHDDRPEGLAHYDEAIAPGKVDKEEEKKRNLGDEGIKEMGCQLASPVGVSKEEKRGSPTVENDTLAEQEQSDLPAKVTETKEHRGLSEVLVPKSEPELNTAAGQMADTQEEKLVGHTESSAMESEVDQDVAVVKGEDDLNVDVMESSTMESEGDQDVAAERNPDLNVKGEDDLNVDGQTESSTLESEVDQDVAAERSLDLNVKGEDDLNVDGHEVMQTDGGPHDDGLEDPAQYNEEIAPRKVDAEEEKKRNLDSEGIKEMGCPLVTSVGVFKEEKGGSPIVENDSLAEQEQSDLPAKVTGSKEHRKRKPEHNVPAEQKMDTEGKIVGHTESSTMESEVDHDAAAERSIDLNVEDQDETLHEVQCAVLKDQSSESERDAYDSTDQMLERDSQHSTPASGMHEEMLITEKEEAKLEDGATVELTETNPEELACPTAPAEAVDYPGRSPEIPAMVGLGAIDEQNVAREDDRKLVEVNTRLREMLEKVLEAGNEQMNAISKLTGRVRELEKKLSNRRNSHVKPRRNCKAAPPRCRSSTKGTAAAA